MLQTFTLKNGLKVATYSIPEMKSVFVDITAKAGSFFDTKEKSGAAHFMEHLLVQGIPSYPTVEDLSEYLESIAGSYNASTSRELVRFNASVPATHLREALKIAGEVFFEPLFPTASVERERGAILIEMKKSFDGLSYKNFDFHRKHRFPKNHPMQLENGGSIKGLTNLSRDDLIDFWQKLFFPANSYLIVVGGFNSQEIKKQIEQAFGGYNQKGKLPKFPDLATEFLGELISIREDREIKACYVDLTWPIPPGQQLSFKEFLPQGVARSILGGLRNSRLYKLLRQQKGLVYSTGFGAYSYQSFGYGVAYAEVTPENLDEMLDLMIKTIHSFVVNGPTQEELDFAKNYSINSSLMEFDHPSSVAGWIKGDLLWEDKIYLPDEYVKLVEKVTLEDVMEFIKKYWDFSKVNLTIQGPIKNSKTNIKKYSDMIKVLK